MKQMSMNDAAALCYNSRQPIPISVDGKQAIYIFNEQLYNEYLELKEAEAVMQGFEQIENGEYVESETFFKEINAKYEI